MSDERELTRLAMLAALRVTPSAMPQWHESSAMIIADTFRPLAERVEERDFLIQKMDRLLVKESVAARERAEKLEAMLREVEWNGPNDRCPYCDCKSTEGHCSTCSLSALLASSPQPNKKIVEDGGYSPFDAIAKYLHR